MLNHEFKLSLSKIYLCILFSMVFGSFLIVCLMPIMFTIKLCLLLAVSIYGYKIIWQFGFLKSKYSIMRLQRSDKDAWKIHTHEKEITAKLLDDSTVTTFVCVLRFKVANEFWTRSCVIFKDALSVDEYKRLIVLLRMC